MSKWKRKSSSSAQEAHEASKERGFDPPYTPGAEPPVMRKPSHEQMVEGKLSVEWFMEMRSIYIDFNADWWNYWGQQWPDFNESMSQLTKMADQCGLDLQKYAPEKVSIHQIKEKDDIFAATERELELMEHQIENSHQYAMDVLDDVKKKRWLDVLRRVRKLQRWAREPIPSEISKGAKKKREVWESMHPIRFALYCDRSTLLSSEGEAQILRIPDHWVWSSMAIMLAWKNRAKYNIKGALIVIPPEHGKTTLWQSIEALFICRRPWEPGAVIHNKFNTAKERFQAVFSYFDENDPRCGRRAALYPEITVDRSATVAEKFFVLQNGKRTNVHQEGSLNAFGIHSKAQGKSIMRAGFDDPADEKEQTETGTRERTNRAFQHTWMQRLRGNESFFVMICTRWHPNDVSGQLIYMLKTGHMKVAYLSLACGDPSTDFEPIWPEVCSREKLRSAYYRLGPAAYACIYQNNPDTEHSRRITRVHYYDWSEWRDKSCRSPEFNEFINSPSTTFYTSADPSGTDNKQSNKAGVTYAAFGPMKRNGQYRLTLVFLERRSMLADQHKLSEYLAEIDRELKVDEHLIETEGGYHATAEDLHKTWGIPRSKIRGMKTGAGNKIARLMRYALHIQSGDVLFPGENTDSGLTVHNEWEPVAEQLIRAGQTVDDEMLDCVRQQLQAVAHMMSFDTASGPKVESDGKNPFNPQMHSFWNTHVKRKPKTPRTRKARYARYAQGMFA